MSIFRISMMAMLVWGFVQASPIGSSRQLLVVTTAKWSATSGLLQRYEKRAKKWQKIGSSIRVKVGKNGLAWGRGLHKIPKGSKRVKREGDGRAPAGIFTLPYAFGDRAYSIKYPYKKMSRKQHCVDDSRSRYYNQIIDSTKSKHDYKSFEYMKFASGLYSYGIFVNHNPKSRAMAGSCIFLHIQKPSGKPTVGCTAMSKLNIKNIIKWLDPKKKPLLIQAPKSEIDSLFEGR